METTTDYNENNAYYRAKKSGRIERVLWKPDFVLYRFLFLIFINLRYSPHFQWFWFGGWVLTDNACLKVLDTARTGRKEKFKRF
jgi:hypothetical protein